PGSNQEIHGAGLGIVNEFTTDGTFVSRFATGANLNAPWGMALAPSNFAKFSGDILVGNVGSGRINAYDPISGAFEGKLKDPNGQQIEVDGLRGLAFGNGKGGTSKNTLYFTAGVNAGAGGLFGRIEVGAPLAVGSISQNQSSVSSTQSSNVINLVFP